MHTEREGEGGELTKVFLCLVCLVDSHQPGLEDSNGGNMVGEDAKRASRRAHVHLLHVHTIVERLEGRRGLVLFRAHRPGLNRAYRARGGEGEWNGVLSIGVAPQSQQSSPAPGTAGHTQNPGSHLVWRSPNILRMRASDRRAVGGAK